MEDADSFRGNADPQGALLRRALGPAHAGRRLGSRGGRARWTARRASRAATRARRPPTPRTTSGCSTSWRECRPNGGRPATTACWPSSTHRPGAARAGLPRWHLRGPHRRPPPRQRWLRVRPHLRAGIRAARRAYRWPDERRGEACAVASWQGSARHGPGPARRGRLTDACSTSRRRRRRGPHRPAHRPAGSRDAGARGRAVQHRPRHRAAGRRRALPGTHLGRLVRAPAARSTGG